MAGDAQTKEGEGGGAAAYEIDWTNPAEIPDDELSQFTETQFMAAKQRRHQWEKDAAKQLAWLEGDQDLEWMPGVTELERIAEETSEGVPLAYQHPVRINVLKGVVQQRIAMLLGQAVSITADPATQEPDDIAASTINVKLLRYMWHTGPESLRTKIVSALWHMFGTGLIFIHPIWDPFAGQPELFMPGGKDPVDETDEERKKVIETFQKHVAKKLKKDVNSVDFRENGGIMLPPGEVRMEFRTGFDISEPEFAVDTDDIDWLIDTRWRSMEWLRFRFGDEAVKGVHPNSQSEDYQHGFARHYARSKRTEEKTKHVRAELVQVHTLWRPVRPWCPSGFMGMVANRQVLSKGPMPYMHGQLPYIKMQELPSEFFRPFSTVGNMMSLQAARNNRRSLVNAAVHMTIAPKYLVEEGADMPDNAMDGEARQIPVANGTVSGNKIKWMEPPPISVDVYRQDEMDRRDLEEVGQIHSSTKGRGESSQQSGKHAQLLQNADRSANTTTREFVETALAQAGVQALWLWYQFVPTKRKVVICGGEFETEVLEFDGKSLMAKSRKGRVPGPYPFNVRLKLGPESNAAEVVAFVNLMVETGTWSPKEIQEDRLKIERIMSPYLPTDKNEDTRHRRNAGAEHVLFLSGKSAPVRYGDDDGRHIRTHMRWTTEDEFKDAVEKKPAIAEAVKLHIYEHMVAESDKRFRQQMVDEETKALLVAELKQTAPDAPGGQEDPNQAQGGGPPLRAAG